MNFYVSKEPGLSFLPADPPHINGSDQSEEISVVVNNPLELHCISNGIPVPKITWMKDGRPLPQNENVHVLRGGEVLRIASAQVVNIFLIKAGLEILDDFAELVLICTLMGNRADISIRASFPLISLSTTSTL